MRNIKLYTKIWSKWPTMRIKHSPKGYYIGKITLYTRQAAPTTQGLHSTPLHVYQVYVKPRFRQVPEPMVFIQGEKNQHSSCSQVYWSSMSAVKPPPFHLYLWFLSIMSLKQ